MARTKKPEPMTVVEFKSYLQGIIDFSGADWSPNKAQWKKIYDIIQNLKDPEPVVMQGRVQQQQPLQQPLRQIDPNRPVITGTTPQQGEVIVQESSLNPQAPAGQVPAGPALPPDDMRKQMVKPGASKVAPNGQAVSSGVTIVTGHKEADETESDFE